ncbi:MAG: DUF1905 domain-containing protein [Bacteroidetes bacterium]|nr:DUF1905 domain-containing protein [Bacteroidota bacterium]
MAKSKSIEYKTKIYKLEHLVGTHYFEVPPDIIDALGGKFKMRLLCTVNDKLTFQGGLVALGNGSGYVSINMSRLKKLGLKFKDEVKISLKKDESEYGMTLSDELKELLAQDEEGLRRFKMLTPGKQRYIIHYVNTVKSSQLRIERAILLITNLKKTKEGKESFRAMLGLE